VPIEDGARTYRNALWVVLLRQPANEINRSRDGQRDLECAETAFDRGVRDALGGVGIGQSDDEDGAGFVDCAQCLELGMHACPFGPKM
jgi:hypothetical protein